MLAHKAEIGGGKGSLKPLWNHTGNEEGVGLIRNQTSAAGDGRLSLHFTWFHGSWSRDKLTTWQLTWWELTLWHWVRLSYKHGPFWSKLMQQLTTWKITETKTNNWRTTRVYLLECLPRMLFVMNMLPDSLVPRPF